MKLTGLVAKVVRADADYFLNNSFIPISVYQDVLSWLDSGAECPAQLTAGDWLESDADYFKKLAWALIKHHWYVAPLMAVMVFFVSRTLRKWAGKLR